MQEQSRNDNLAILIEPDVDEVVDEITERYKRGIFYVNFGNEVIALHPQSNNTRQENSPENGKIYCSKKHIPKLPAHVYALANDVYRDATFPKSLREAHSIYVSGVAGSGKTEISEMLVEQLFRAAKVSSTNDVACTLMKGFSALKRLLTCKSVSGPTSSTASVVVTLYFGQGGRLKTAKITPYLLNPRYVIPHTQDKGYLNIFYDLVAALLNEAPGLSIKDNSDRILQEMKQSMLQMDQQTIVDHKNHWMDFIENILDLDIGQNVQMGRLGYANSFLDSLLGLLLLATTQFSIEQNTRQFHLQSKNNFSIAAQLFGVSDQALYNSVMTGASNHGDLPPVNAVQSRDQLVYEVYSRLVTWLATEINNKLPDVENGDIPVNVADLPPFLDNSSGSLEDLCQNLVAEYVQMLQNKAVFARESDACQVEGLKVPPVKRQRCDDIVDMAFPVPHGLFQQLETSCNNLAIPDKSLLKSIDTHFKTRKDLYMGSKKLGSGKFAILHSHKQVEYHVNPLFRYQDLIIPNRQAQNLLLSSRNITLQNVFKPAIKELSNPNVRSHFSYIDYIRVQINALRDQLFGTIPHLVRCIRPSTVGSVLDEGFMKCQVKSAYLPDIIHRKKFGYSHWMTIHDFLRRYKYLDFSLLTNAAISEETCKLVLKKVGILEKGPAITKKYVFLGYWHKEELDLLANNLIWKITLVQACVRGHLTRRKLLEEAAAARRGFRDRVPSFRTDGNASRISIEQIHEDDAKEDELFESMISKTLTRVSDLPSSAWAKVVYMKQMTEVAKVYAAELSLLVTGSNNPFDQLELGLSYFNTNNILDEADYIVENLEQGIELRRDSDGSILIKRNCPMPVCVKPHRSQPVLSVDILETRGYLPLGHFSKIFDMQEFHSLISLELQKPKFSKINLQKSCITVIRFGNSDLPNCRMPCWLAVININALNVLDDTKVLESISLMTSQLTLNIDKKDNETKEELEEAKMRRQRKQWSRIDQRPQSKMKEANSRKIREELRRRGEKISDHMKYSWEEGVAHKAVISMDKLYEEMRRNQTSDASSPSSPDSGQNSQVRNWAKINVALRNAMRDLQRAEAEETSSNKQHPSL